MGENLPGGFDLSAGEFGSAILKLLDDQAVLPAIVDPILAEGSIRFGRAVNHAGLSSPHGAIHTSV